MQTLSQQAIYEWCRSLASDHVLEGWEECGVWGRRTFGPDIEVPVRLRPGSVEEVADALRIASAFRIPVHPVSRGANWGLGSRAPTVSGAAVLDLSRLDRISGYDGNLGVVHVEPGVTFAALAKFLKKRDSRFFIPEIGGSPDASVLANALDRGDGAMGDRWGSLSDLTVVMPDGTRMTTGFAAARADRLAGCHPSIAGPIPDGLFSQSNLGVVVGAMIRLEPMPRNLAVFNARVRSFDGLIDLLTVWRDAQIDGVISGRSATMWNGVKFLARENSRRHFPEAEVREAEAEIWRLSGYLTAESPDMLDLRFRGLLDRFQRGNVEASGAAVRLDAVWEPGCGTVLGTPSPRNLRTAYWARKTVPAFDEMDPDADGCGLLWLCLAFPFDTETLLAFVKSALPVLRAAGIDFNIGLESPGHQWLLSYVSLIYDRSAPGKDDEAMACYRTLLAIAVSLEIAPYRLANGAETVPAYADSTLHGYLAEIRALRDPHGILSPGRGGLSP